MQKSILALSAIFLLTACESMKDSLGLTHYQADEFNVKQHDALEVPPNYDLMPPRKKEKDKDGNSIPVKETAVKAREVVGGESTDSDAALSKESEQDLKEKVGAADDSVRKEIDKDAEVEEDSAVDKKLSAWKKEFVENAASISKDAKEKTKNQEDSAAANANDK
jgi:hypothetical protein